MHVSMNHAHKICHQNNIAFRGEKMILSKEGCWKVSQKILEELTNEVNFIPKNQRKKKDLLEFDVKYNVDTTEIVIKNSIETCDSKSKGMFQTICEKRLLDVEIFCIECFSGKGSNEFGNMIKATNLRPLLSSCPEFI